MPADKGSVKVKAKCPQCGLTVTETVSINRESVDISCRCGQATLQVVMASAFQWEVENKKHNFF